MSGLRRVLMIAALCCLAPAAYQAQVKSALPQKGSAAASAPAPRAVLDKYCVTCHNQRLKTAGLTLDM